MSFKVIINACCFRSVHPSTSAFLTSKFCFRSYLICSALKNSSHSSSSSSKLQTPLPKPQLTSNKSDCERPKTPEVQQKEEELSVVDKAYAPFPGGRNPSTGEIGGPRGPEPTRYGDWERKGRCIDFWTLLSKFCFLVLSFRWGCWLDH